MRNPLAAMLSLRAPLLLLLAALLVSAASATPTSAESRIKIISSRQDPAAAPAAPAAAAAAAPAAAAAAAPAAAIAAAAAPATAAGTPLNVALACAQYSRVANLTAIAANSTLRATFLDVSPVGTFFNEALLTQAQNALPPLTADAALNAACGNLTAVALAEAAVNFTNGIIGEFRFTGSHTSIVNGPVTLGVTIAALVIILGPISAL